MSGSGRDGSWGGGGVGDVVVGLLMWRDVNFT